MEYYIQEGNLLLLRHEWNGGIIPKDKIIKAREKLVKNGQATIVDPSFFDSSIKKKVMRKR